MASKRENFHVIWAYLSFCCLVLNQKVNFLKSLLRTSLPAICDPRPATRHPPHATCGKVLPVGGCIRRWFKVTGLGVDWIGSNMQAWKIFGIEECIFGGDLKNVLLSREIYLMQQWVAFCQWTSILSPMLSLQSKWSQMQMNQRSFGQTLLHIKQAHIRGWLIVCTGC